MVRGKANELKDFIDYSVSKGISKEQIKQMLLQSGWPKELVSRIFARPKGGAMLSAGNNVLKMVNITKSFGQNLVLDSIDISVKPGEIFGIIGLSGSGKTTLLNTIVGFVEPDEGDVVIKSEKESNDYLVSERPSAIKEIFGFASQRPSFYSMLTVEENLTHFSSLYRIAKKERKMRCEALIDMVGLTGSEKILARNLSGGMKKRLDIACSLVHNPRILILGLCTKEHKHSRRLFSHQISLQFPLPCQ